MAASWPVIVFLDVDGVINHHGCWAEPESPKIDSGCIRRLNRIVEATDSRIVVSSAWRYQIHGHAMTLLGFSYMLRTHGLKMFVNGQCVVIDITARDEDIAERPDQIRAWLKYNGMRDQRYVILDDLDADWGDLKIVRTDPVVGLTDADVERAIAILSEPEEGADDTAEFEAVPLPVPV